MRNSKNALLYILASLLFFSCAQIVAPTGGPKDETPPKALKYFPELPAVHFKEKRIEIIFDEYIGISDIGKQLIISPPLDKQPKISVKEKTLLIKFDESTVLDSNTTYVFNFGAAIHDINEANKIEKFSYIFSTGSYLDSLSISGKIKGAYNLKTKKDVSIMLYTNTNDSVIFKDKPLYYAKTNEEGDFTLENLKPNTYKIIALEDDNNNYKYDEGESVGFYDSLITLPSNTPIHIYTFKELPTKTYIKKHSHNSFGHATLTFNCPVDSVTISPINSHLTSDNSLSTVNKEGDKADFWFRDVEADSLQLEIKQRSTVIDTLLFKTIKEKELIEKKRPTKLALLTKTSKKELLNLNQAIRLSFNHPISNVNYHGIALFEDSTLIEASKQFLLLAEETSPNILTLKNADSSNYQLKGNSTYKLEITQNSITDFFGLKNDSISINFSTQTDDFYGSASIAIELPSKSMHTIQLLNSKNKVVSEKNIDRSQKLTFDLLAPDSYKLKVIEDLNGNKKWDTGNILKKIQAEKVYIYATPLKIRSNWNIEESWSL